MTDDTPPALFRICSGQSYFTRVRNPNAPDWGVCLAYDYYFKCPWWRAEDRKGRYRRFRLRLEALAAPHRAEIERMAGLVAQGGGDTARRTFGEGLTALLSKPTE